MRITKICEPSCSEVKPLNHNHGVPAARWVRVPEAVKILGHEVQLWDFHVVTILLSFGTIDLQLE